jgi:hypothetical protein
VYLPIDDVRCVAADTVATVCFVAMKGREAIARGSRPPLGRNAGPWLLQDEERRLLTGWSARRRSSCRRATSRPDRS